MMVDTNHNGDDGVGYGKPPKATRFKPGQSGNPKGRPRRQKAKELDIAGILDASVEINLGAKSQTVSGFEAGVWKIAEQAIKGDLKAMKKFIKLCEEYRVIDQVAVQQGGVIFAPKGISPHEWIESLNRDEFECDQETPASKETVNVERK